MRPARASRKRGEPADHVPGSPTKQRLYAKFVTLLLQAAAEYLLIKYLYKADRAQIAILLMLTRSIYR